MLASVAAKQTPDTGSSLAKRRIGEHMRLTNRLKEAANVHAMRLAGVSYSRIAQQLGISPQGCSDRHLEYLEYLRELETLGSVDANKRLQDERYETLLSTVWDMAMQGNLLAVKECRAILDSISAREAKVTSMISRTEDNTTVTVVAEGSDDAYIRALQEMSR